MSSPITKKTLEHLAKLARIELNASEEKKLLADLSKILDHFKELQELDTSNVPPMTGGTDLKNVFREDAGGEGPEADASHRYGAGTNRGEGVDAFPEKENGFLKIPPVFE
ncbi:MAG: Asp-tRNA(Asn)/Glu-tRNA(Gln) amidotransferase subunit GatC [Candidatus Liptonbacteria bacterium]|nr:Asp-tRNA(Asn)/Glu-tRNA(Gln) amidotransferase subunit GatC [Candidatus Liptonbacteria bacterium]